MTCDTADAYLHRSLDESLTQSERVALDDHWDECAACRRERDSQRRLAHLAHQWAAQTLASSDPGEAFTMSVLARLDTPPKRSPRSYLLPLAVTSFLFSALFFSPGSLFFPAGSLASDSVRLPHWLAKNLFALPGDAQALRPLPEAVFGPLWGRILLPLAVGLNVVFCLSARQAELRRSVS